MERRNIQEIERAIEGLPAEELAELYAWLDRHHYPQLNAAPGPTIFEQGLGLFGGPVDATLLDEVVRIAYEERRRPGRPPRCEG
jgi:hypothetical protein